MEQKNNKQTKINKDCRLDPEQVAILRKFEEDITKQAKDLQDSLSDMSADKLASVFYKCFVLFMTEGRAKVLCESKEKFSIAVYDLLLSKTIKRAEKSIKEQSDIIHRAFVRSEELEKTLHPDDIDQIDLEAILKEETEKYYAEKKDNDPKAD